MGLYRLVSVVFTTYYWVGTTYILQISQICEELKLKSREILLPSEKVHSLFVQNERERKRESIQLFTRTSGTNMKRRSFRNENRIFVDIAFSLLFSFSCKCGTCVEEIDLPVQVRRPIQFGNVFPSLTKSRGITIGNLHSVRGNWR